MQQSILTPSPSSRRPPVRRAPASSRDRAGARLAGGIDGAFYQHIVTNMRNGVLAITREGTLALINDIACDVLGLSDGPRQLGRPIADAFKDHPEILFVLADVF